MIETHVCRSLAATRRLAQLFAKVLKQADRAVVLFEDADMGSGKTTFTSAVVASLNPKAQAVVSPTFTIINQYSENIFHIDLYRIESEQELANTDFADIIAGSNYVFIEWSKLATSKFEGRIFRISIRVISETAREFTIREDFHEKA